MTQRSNTVRASAAVAILPVGRKSLVDSVVETLTARIIGGQMPAGQALPSEQELAARLKVSRTAVREALNRLATARLVSLRHSTGKTVLDYRRSAGLELLPTLLIVAGAFNPSVVASVMEMRSALAPDIARLAALRRNAEVSARLRATIAGMRAAGGDLAALQDCASEFWDHLVDASDNIAYRLAYNSLRTSYDQTKQALTQVLADETGDIPAYADIADAVDSGDAAAAEAAARRLVRRGEAGVKRALGLFAARRGRLRR